MAERDAAAVFAESVRRERLAQGLTLKALSEKSGIPAATISKVETRAYGTTLRLAADLAAGLGASVGFLLGEQPGGGHD